MVLVETSWLEVYKEQYFLFQMGMEDPFLLKEYDLILEFVAETA